MLSLGPNPAEIGQPTTLRPAERRRRVRHKLHLPAYVGLASTPNLSEILDLSEDGMAIQTGSPLEIGREEKLRLQLPESGASVETFGVVIWSNESGCNGIQFLDLPPQSLQALKKWLFADALVGCARAAEARGATELRRHENERDHTALLSALDAVRKEVESLGSDLDAAMQLIARRAQAFTSSTAAAIGLTEGEDMICRATAGPNAPAVGVRLRAGSGFSGECVRSGILLRCDDSESDARVDRESCRALGIRSMIAAPVLSQASVIGLIEVFACEPKVFRPEHEFVLQRLTEEIAAAVVRARLPEAVPASAPVATLDDEFPVETPADLPIFNSSRNLLLSGLAATVLLGLLWMTQNWVTQSRSTNGKLAAGSSATQEAALRPSASKLDVLQKLAAGGDPVAQFDVAVRYWTGDEVPQDYGQAVHWLSLAADQGNVAAQSMLGNCYGEGRGVGADPMRAYFWAFLGQAGGDVSSQPRVALFASRLSAGQVAVVQKQANDWMAQHPRAVKESSPMQ